MKTKAVSDAVEYMSLNKVLQYCRVSNAPDTTPKSPG